MKKFSCSVYFLVSILSILFVSHLKGQSVSINNCEVGINIPRFLSGASTDDGTGAQGNGSVGGPGTLAWTYTTAPLANPVATPFSGTRVLQANTNAAGSGTSRKLMSGIIDFSRSCANAQMTFGFWMYRTGTDANADRVNVWVDNNTTLAGATLLTTINRSRALSPVVYGLNGWYYYEVLIPSTFGATTYLTLDVVDGSAGPNGNIYIDDLKLYDNGGAPASVNGGVANAGNDISICTNGSYQIGATSTPSTTYAWAPGSGLSNTTISNPFASPAGTTNYTVTATTTGAGCTTAKTDIVVVTVTGAQAPVITSAPSTNACSGNALSFPFAASNSPTGYLWLAADNVSTVGESNVISVNAATLNDNITTTSSQVVTYSVSATNASCGFGTTPIQTFSVNITVPTVTITGGTILCSGGTAVLNAIGSGISTYSWSNGSTASAINVPAGSHQCTVTSAGGCTAITSYVLTQPSALTSSSAGTSAICSGVTTNIFLSGSGGTPPYTYSWVATSNPNVSGESLTVQSGSIIANTLVNTTISNQAVPYTFTVTDANGCMVSTVYGVTVNASPTVTISSTPIACNGGTGNLTANGTAISTYSWNTGATTSSIIGSAGVYTCIVTSTASCQASNTYVLTQPTILSSSLSGPTTICSGVTTNNSISGIGGTAPYNFSWIAASNLNVNGESLALQTTSVIANTLDNISGVNQNVTYTYNVTDANSCIISSVQSITVRAPLSSSTSGPTFLCSGATANIMISGIGGTPAYSFTWIAASNPNVTGESTLGGAGSTINDILVNTSATTQSVNYTYNVFDANGCVAVGTKTLTVYSPSITISAPSNTSICQTGTTTFNAPATGGSGFYTYQWQEDNGGGFFNLSDIGVYSGTGTANLTITAPAPSMNGYRYRCQINDGCNSSLSGVAILSVIPAFYYSAGTAEQPILSSVGRCASKQEILRFKVDLTVGACPSTPTVINIAFTAAGTQGDAKKAYIYYTGSNPNFSTNNLYATITSVVGGTINASGSRIVTPGTNYFWLAYDIDPLGVGSFVDATWSTITFSGGAFPGTYTLSTGSPPGSRNISTCVAPGGISSGLTYWLKSNDGNNLSSNVHDAPINSWSSTFTNSSDLTQPTSTKQPLFKDYPHDTLFNFNPYLSFDGSDDILQNTSLVDLLSDDGLAMVICARNLTPNNRTCFAFSTTDDFLRYQIKPEDELSYQNAAGTKVVSFNVTGFTDPDTDFKQAKMVAIHGNSSGAPDFADFMRNDDVFQSSGTTAPNIEEGLTIGGSGDGGAYNRSNGTIAEIITYNKNLSSAELNKVQTYAAIKYGIHLNKDYTSSAGDVVWDYAADPTFNNDITGIGRDDKSGLNQKQSQSVNLDEMLTISLDSIESSNKNNTATFAVDNSFLLWGNNNLPAYSDPTTSIPAAAPLLPPGIEGRILRVWKLQGTNFGTAGNNFKNANGSENNKVTATTRIAIAFDDELLQGVTPSSSLRLLVDDDGTNFSNAIVKGPGKSTTGANASGARLVFDTVEVGGGRNFITLATIDMASTPLPIQLIDFYTDCKNNQIILNWKTASEINVKEFVIEHSTDGVTFSPFKIISPKGSQHMNATYTVAYENTSNEITYFRLKEITTTNEHHYYKIISAGNCGKSERSNSAVVTPNPISSSVGETVIRFSSSINGNTKINLLNSLGNIVFQNDYTSGETYNAMKLSFKGLPNGVYFIELNNNKGLFRLKFIVVD